MEEFSELPTLRSRVADLEAKKLVEESARELIAMSVDFEDRARRLSIYDSHLQRLQRSRKRDLTPEQVVSFERQIVDYAFGFTNKEIDEERTGRRYTFTPPHLRPPTAEQRERVKRVFAEIAEEERKAAEEKKRRIREENARKPQYAMSKDGTMKRIFYGEMSSIRIRVEGPRAASSSGHSQ